MRERRAASSPTRYTTESRTFLTGSDGRVAVGAHTPSYETVVTPVSLPQHAESTAQAATYPSGAILEDHVGRLGMFGRSLEDLVHGDHGEGASGSESRSRFEVGGWQRLRGAGWTQDTEHRTQDAGHKTQGTGRRTQTKVGNFKARKRKRQPEAGKLQQAENSLVKTVKKSSTPRAAITANGWTVAARAEMHQSRHGTIKISAMA